VSAGVGVGVGAGGVCDVMVELLEVLVYEDTRADRHVDILT